jgi:hypothetical protein
MSYFEFYAIKILFYKNIILIGLHFYKFYDVKF